MLACEEGSKSLISTYDSELLIGFGSASCDSSDVAIDYGSASEF